MGLISYNLLRSMRFLWWWFTAVMVVSLYSGTVNGRLMSWGNPKVLKRRKASLERARAIVKQYDNFEDLVIDSLVSLTALLAPSIEWTLNIVDDFIAQLEDDITQGAYDGLLKSEYFTRVVLELRRVLPYLSSFPAIDGILKISNVPMRRFAVKLAVSTAILPLMDQFREDILAYLDAPGEQCRYGIGKLRSDIRTRIQTASRSLLTCSSSDVCGPASGRDELSQLHSLIMTFLGQLSAAWTDNPVLQSVIPREIVAYVDRPEGQEYIGVYLSDVLAAYTSEIQWCATVLKRLRDGNVYACNTTDCRLGEDSIEQLRLILVSQTRQLSCAKGGACEELLPAMSVIAVVLSIIEWMMDQVHAIGLYVDDLLASPERFQDSLRWLLQTLSLEMR